jgi:4-hydroxy-tetrahydrodipicolinate reductase
MCLPLPVGHAPATVETRAMTAADPPRPATRIVLVGANGRMGRRIEELARGRTEVLLTMRLGRETTAADGTDDGNDVDCVIDFSSVDGTRRAIAFARERRAALLVGTTGLPDAVLQELRALAATNAVLVAPNTSLGVALVRRLARIAAETLGPAGWSVDLVESHHDRKKDAPSGTALALARSVEEGGMRVEEGRIHAIRAGDTVGEHEVRFAGPGERIHLFHQAVARDLFAEGALRAARWLHGRAPGLYGMDDVLG